MKISNKIRSDSATETGVFPSVNTHSTGFSKKNIGADPVVRCSSERMSNLLLFRSYYFFILNTEHRKRVPLWIFLLHLLYQDDSSLVEWSCKRDFEFRIVDPDSVAQLWGSVKYKKNMTYEKLGRALRYYYGKDIIEKVICQIFS